MRERESIFFLFECCTREICTGKTNHVVGKLRKSCWRNFTRTKQILCLFFPRQTPSKFKEKENLRDKIAATCCSWKLELALYLTVLLRFSLFVYLLLLLLLHLKRGKKNCSLGLRILTRLVYLLTIINFKQSGKWNSHDKNVSLDLLACEQYKKISCWSLFT